METRERRHGPADRRGHPQTSADARILTCVFLNKGDLVAVVDRNGRIWTERVAEDTPYQSPVQTVPLRDSTDPLRRAGKILAGILNAIPR